jgi:type II secretory pathway pseudopilin PulG
MNRKASIQILDGSTKRHRERGFALLEILVAFVILALGLGAISSGVAVAMRSDGRTQTSRFAFRVAQSRLEAAGITEALIPGHREGRVASLYKWEETVEAVHIGADPPGPRDAKSNQIAANPGIVPVWIEITVQTADRTIAKLAALKLVPGSKQ